MITFPDTEKKLKSRISGYRSALNKELKTLAISMTVPAKDIYCSPCILSSMI